MKVKLFVYLSLVIFGVTLSTSSFSMTFMSQQTTYMKVIYTNNKLDHNQLDDLTRRTQGDALVKCMLKTGSADNCKLIYSKIVEILGVDKPRCMDVQIKITARALYEVIQKTSSVSAHTGKEIDTSNRNLMKKETISRENTDKSAVRAR
jgi:hypothetical protein